MISDETEQQRNFLQISVHLTGFSEIDLLGTGMLKTYMETCQRKTSENPASWPLFLQKARKIIALKDQTGINAAIKNNLLAGELEDLTKNVIKMWYLGNWYPLIWNGESWEPKPKTLPEVISVNSYKEGLVWKAVETHPPGAKQPGFGSWSKPPHNPLNQKHQ